MAGSKKNSARRRVTIVFIDESGFSERPSVRRTWAPRGQTPVLTAKHRSWGQLSAIGGLAYRAGYSKPFLLFHRGVVRSPQIVQFLKHLRRHVRGRVLVIWDGLHAHRSAFTRDYVEANRHWLEVHRLPGYAPELNPVEGMWAWFKGTATANLCPEDLAGVTQRVRLARRQLRRRTGLPWSFLRKAGLSF